MLRIVFNCQHVIQGLFNHFFITLIQRDGKIPMKTAGLVWIGRCVVIPGFNPVIATTDLVLDSYQIIIFTFFIIMFTHGIIVIVVQNITIASPALVCNPFNGNVSKGIILYNIIFLEDFDVCIIWHRILQIMAERISGKNRCLLQPIPSIIGAVCCLYLRKIV